MRASNQFADSTSGVVYIHASPAAVCPHVEWALSSTLRSRANLNWTPQPAMPGQLRAVTNWVGPVGTGRTAGQRAAVVVGAAVRGDRGSQRRRRRSALLPHPATRAVERRDERQRRRDGRRDAAAVADGVRRRHAGRRTGFGARHRVGRSARALSQRRRHRRGDLAQPRSRASRRHPAGSRVPTKCIRTQSTASRVRIRTLDVRGYRSVAGSSALR